MSRKFLILIAVAFAAIFAVAVAAVMSANSISNAPVQPGAAAPSSTPSPVVAAAPAPAPEPPIQPKVTAPVPAELPPAPIGSSYVVSDSDIAPLAVAVNLRDPKSTVSKEVWAKELPVAKKLMNGLCDCDQRNFLRHFVETGDKALSDANDYPESLELLAKLRHSNADLEKQGSSQR